MHRLSNAPEHCYQTCHIVWRSIHMIKKTRRAPALLTTATSGHMSADGRVEPEPEMSLAAGTMARATGQRDHGPAHAQAARAQHAQTGTNARAAGGAPVKKEAKHHRRRASLPSWHGLCDEFDATPLDPR